MKPSSNAAPTTAPVYTLHDFDFVLPPDGVHIRWPDKPLDQEFRLHKYKLYAALAFARANKIDKMVIDSPKPRFGIISLFIAACGITQCSCFSLLEQIRKARMRTDDNVTFQVAHIGISQCKAIDADVSL